MTINGHTDNTGNDAINEPLSRNRAESVATFLQSRGVSSTRLSTFGYGSRQPIASNATVEGRAQNRRVEILINPDQRAIDAAKKQMKSDLCLIYLIEGRLKFTFQTAFSFAVFIGRFFLFIRLNIKFIPLLTRLFNFSFKKTVIIL